MNSHYKTYLELMHRALAAEHGLVLITPEPKRAREILNRVRKAAQDPSLSELTISISPLDDGDLVLWKGNTNAPKQRKLDADGLLTELGL